MGNIAVNDDVAGAATYLSGDDGDGWLQAGEMWVYVASYTLQAADVGELVNTCTVAGQHLYGGDVMVQGEHHTVVSRPAPETFNLYLPLVVRLGTP